MLLLMTEERLDSFKEGLVAFNESFEKELVAYNYYYLLSLLEFLNSD